MICYLDQTFCGSPNCQGKCGRQFTAAHREAARKWWGKDGAPVAFADLCDENGERRILEQPEPVPDELRRRT